MGREARPACLPCGSKPISDKSQGVWGTASPNLIPPSHVRAHSLIYPEILAINYRAHAHYRFMQPELIDELQTKVREYVAISNGSDAV